MRNLAKTSKRVEQFFKEYEEADETTRPLLIGRPLNAILQSLLEHVPEDESIEEQIHFLNVIAGLMTRLKPFLLALSEPVVIKITEMELVTLRALINKVTLSGAELTTIDRQYQQCNTLFQQIALIKDQTPSNEAASQLLSQTGQVIHTQKQLQQHIADNLTKLFSDISSGQPFHTREIKNNLTLLQSQINTFWLASENERINAAFLEIAKVDLRVKEQITAQIILIQENPWAPIPIQKTYYSQFADAIKMLLSNQGIELTAEEKQQYVELLRMGLMLTRESNYIQLLRDFTARFYMHEPIKIEEINTYLESCTDLRKRVQFNKETLDNGKTVGVKRRVTESGQESSERDNEARAHFRARLDVSDQMSVLESFFINIMDSAKLEGQNISRIYVATLFKNLSEAVFNLKIPFAPKVCISYDLLMKAQTPAQVNPELSRKIDAILAHFQKQYSPVLNDYRRFSEKESSLNGSIPYAEFKKELTNIVIQLKALVKEEDTNAAFRQLIEDWMNKVSKENIIDRRILGIIRKEYFALIGHTPASSQTTVSTSSTSSSTSGTLQTTARSGTVGHPQQGGLRLFSPAATTVLPTTATAAPTDGAAARMGMGNGRSVS